MDFNRFDLTDSALLVLEALENFDKTKVFAILQARDILEGCDAVINTKKLKFDNINSSTETGELDEVLNIYGQGLMDALELIPSMGKSRAIAPFVAAVAFLIDETGEVGCLKNACELFVSNDIAGNSLGEGILAQVRDLRFNLDKRFMYFTRRKNFHLTTRLYRAALESYLYDAELPLDLTDEVNDLSLDGLKF